WYPFIQITCIRCIDNRLLSIGNAHAIARNGMLRFQESDGKRTDFKRFFRVVGDSLCIIMCQDPKTIFILHMTVNRQYFITFPEDGLDEPGMLKDPDISNMVWMVM